jgi:hypothetical protein
VATADLIADVGSATANAFVEVDTATDYLAGRLNSDAWTDASSNDKAKALIEATREITLLPFQGSRVDTTQALAWPRSYAVNPDRPSLALLGTVTDLYYADDVIPQRVQDATCELALEFLKAGTSDVASRDATAGVIRKVVDVLETEYAKPYERPQGLARYPRVVSLLSPLMDVSTSGYTVARC